MSDAELFFRDDDNTAAVWRSVFIQIRHRHLTDAFLLAMRVPMRNLLRRHPQGIATLGVLESSAMPVAEDVRQRQKEMFDQVIGGRPVITAVVIEGDGVQASLMRTVTRGVHAKMPGMKARVGATVQEVGPWLVESMTHPQLPSFTLAELQDVVSALRKTARQ